MWYACARRHPKKHLACSRYYPLEVTSSVNSKSSGQSGNAVQSLSRDRKGVRATPRLHDVLLG